MNGNPYKKIKKELAGYGQIVKSRCRRYRDGYLASAIYSSGDYRSIVVFFYVDDEGVLLWKNSKYVKNREGEQHEI